jgi:predicted RNase H-like HicB family nuclease
MAVRYYRVLLHRDGERGWSAVFPDLPGCATCGDSVDHALRMAMDAAEGWVEATLEAGEPVPEPVPLPAWMLEDEEIDWSAGQRALVPVEVPGRAVRVNISMDEGLVQRIDRAAEARGMSRSAFLAEGARRLLAEA